MIVNKHTKGKDTERILSERLGEDNIEVLKIRKNRYDVQYYNQYSGGVYRVTRFISGLKVKLTQWTKNWTP